MDRIRAVIDATDGSAEFVPFGDLWGVAALLADALPLDRPPVYARPLRRLGHWARLVLFDRAVTNREATAIVTLARTPWVPAIAAGVVAAAIGPQLRPWQRRALVVGTIAYAVRNQRLRRFVEMRRGLRRIAPRSLLVGDFVAKTPGTAVPWIVDTLDALGARASLTAILPGSGQERRHRARERIYTTRFGFHVAERTTVAERGAHHPRAPGRQRCGFGNLRLVDEGDHAACSDGAAGDRVDLAHDAGNVGDDRHRPVCGREGRDLVVLRRPFDLRRPGCWSPFPLVQLAIRTRLEDTQEDRVGLDTVWRWGSSSR